MHASTCWFLAASFLLSLGAFLLYFRTERRRRLYEKRIEEQTTALQERETQYRDLVERASDGIVIVKKGVIAFANQRAIEIAGYSMEEALGKPFVDFVIPEKREEISGLYALRIAGKPAPALNETRLLHKDGTFIDVEISGRLIPYQGDLANLVLVRDITPRRNNEQKLKQYSKQLEDANKQLETAISRTSILATKAEAANRAKNEFLANMSHELRTPLTTIVGMTELLRDEAFGAITPSQRDGLKTIDASTQHLLDLINDILDLARIETGRVELERKAVDVKALCGVCARFMQDSAQRKLLKVSIDCSSAPEKVWADPRRLRQILINLLGNAVKFTPEGGEMGIIATRAEPGGGCKFTVWDTGIGVAPDKLHQIFEPFEQADTSQGRKYGGAGLGLTMVQRLVAMHGGNVSVQSVLGQGSRFTFIIPDLATIMMEPAPQGGVPSPAPEQWLRGLRILVAEDDETNAQIIEMQLRHRGCEVAIAVNGQEAIDITPKFNPDVILMDIQMPVVSGLKATKCLKSDAATASIPIVCLTALALDEDRARCLEAGADAYVTKPVDFPHLISTIASLKHRPRSAG
jgi:PAS domain S-box-containing protein